MEKAESLISGSAILTVRDGLKFYRRYWAESVFRRPICLSDDFFFKFGLFVDKAVNRRVA